MKARKLSILQLFPTKRKAAAVASRWSEASAAEPQLIEDLIEMGGIMSRQPETFENGIAVGPIDPIRLAKLEGRRELAVELCSLMGCTPYDLSELFGDDRNDTL